MSTDSSIIDTVSKYYSATVAKHGATPQGVDWNSEDSQNIRFAQLSKIFDQDKSQFSLLDYGSGWGALLDFIRAEFPSKKVAYTGYDIVPDMLTHAKTIHPDIDTWLSEIPSAANFDYVVASGIFNVRQKHNDSEWQEYVEKILHQFNALSVKGFAFNMLTSYSDEDKMRDYLYYANPNHIFDFCKRHFSKNVALLHDYPLYEFTILVRK